MTQKTRSTITTEINAQVIENTSGLITATQVQGILDDINDSSQNTLSDTGTPPGMQTLIQNGGLQLIAGSRSNMGATSGSVTANLNTRTNFIPAASANHLVLVYGNWNTNNSLGENPGLCAVKVKCSLEYLSVSGVTSETGARVPVTFQGRRFVDVPADGIVYSDPIPFTAVAGTPFFVRTYVTAPGSGFTIPTGIVSMGGTGPGAMNNGEGTQPAADRTDGTLTVTQQYALTSYGPCAILGWNPNYVPSAGILGDSIAVGSSDGGYSSLDGGYLVRAMTNQLALVQTYPVTPLVPFTRSARGGETITGFITQSNSSPGSGGLKRTQLANLASTVVTEYGTNDFAETLAVMKANFLILANTFLAAGKYFVACTLLPKSTSTDNYVTVANQTKFVSEANRVAFNNWLRDQTATGFSQQTGYPTKASYFDAANAVEVNSSNVLTQDGGYWMAPASAVPLTTGTATASTSSVVINDTGKAFTQDQYKGYVLAMTSGAASGFAQTIYGNTTTALQIIGMSPAPSSGDTYKVYQAYTIDGTHPTSIGHQTIAAAFPISLIK